MEEFSDSYNGCEADAPASWAEQQHECVQELDEVETLRRKVKFYFMNPCEKYHARGRKPWKLMLQIVKIAIITIQVVHFYTWSGQVWCSFVFFIFSLVTHVSFYDSWFILDSVTRWLSNSEKKISSHSSKFS